MPTTTNEQPEPQPEPQPKPTTSGSAPSFPSTPIPGDGILTIQIPGEEGSSMPMEDSTRMAFEQGFQQQHQGAMHSFRRMSDAADNVAEQTRLGFILTQQLVGAKAAGNLNMDPLGKAILDQRSVADQPVSK